MKYLRLADDSIIMFSTNLAHCDVARGWQVESAGECEVGTKDGKIEVWAGGRSISLKKESDPTDHLFIQKMIERSSH
jgi:hypothetical protein